MKIAITALTSTLGVLVLSSAVLPQTPASTDDASAMADYFANTLTIDIPDVWHAKRYFVADHTYTQTGSDGPVHGTWSIEDGKVCTVQVPAAPHRLEKYCNIGVGKHAGETWDDTDPMYGSKITFGLVAGRPSD